MIVSHSVHARFALGLLSVAMSIATTASTGNAQSLTAALRIEDPAGGFAFGRALAGRSGKLIVGGGLTAAGLVYVIDGSSGDILLTLTNPSGVADDRFGFSVAWVGDNVLVGAPFADVAGTDRGAAYIFDGASGALLHTLTRPGAVNGWFGYSVAALGDDALIGQIGLLEPTGEGVYLFDGATGALLLGFVDPTAGTAGSGRFGQDVAVIGADVLIGSPFGADTAYRLDSAGTLLQTYVDPEGGDDDEFGASIAAVGSHVAIGVGTNGGGGKAYLFDAATGAFEHEYLPPFVSDSLFFGLDLAAVGSSLAIGSNDGVFVYETSPPYDLIQTLGRPYPHGEDHDGFGGGLGTSEDGLLVGAGGSAVVFDACGNGTRTAREQCDDGGLADGDGCSSICHLEICGTAPAAGCATASKSGFSVRAENSIFGTKDAMKWTWKGAATDLADFGDPLSTADFVVCVYDLVETITPRLRMSTALTGGGDCDGEPCWEQQSATALRYADRAATPSGITKFGLKTSASSTKAKLLGKGPDLEVPDGVLGVIPFAGLVTVQLVSTTGSACLEAEFAVPALVNAKGRYKDRTD
jgi:cysteine-rich repeat protein